MGFTLGRSNATPIPCVQHVSCASCGLALGLYRGLCAGPNVGSTRAVSPLTQHAAADDIGTVAVDLAAWTVRRVAGFADSDDLCRCCILGTWSRHLHFKDTCNQPAVNRASKSARVGWRRRHSDVHERCRPNAFAEPVSDLHRRRAKACGTGYAQSDRAYG